MKREVCYLTSMKIYIRHKKKSWKGWKTWEIYVKEKEKEYVEDGEEPGSEEEEKDTRKTKGGRDNNKRSLLQ